MTNVKARNSARNSKQKREISAKLLVRLIDEHHTPSSIARLLKVPKDRVFRRIGQLTAQNILLSSRAGKGPKSWSINPLHRRKPGGIPKPIQALADEYHHIKLVCKYSGAQPTFTKQKEANAGFNSWPCGRSKQKRVYQWRESSYSIATYPNGTLEIWLTPLKGLPAKDFVPRVFELATRISLEFERHHPEIDIIPGTLRLVEPPDIVPAQAVQKALEAISPTAISIDGQQAKLVVDSTPEPGTVEIRGSGGLGLQGAIENLPKLIRESNELRKDVKTLRSQVVELALSNKGISEDLAGSILEIKGILEKKKEERD